MSNHYHVVFIDEESAKSWINHEVIERWCLFYKGPYYVQKLLVGDQLSSEELEAVNATAKEWRGRLRDLSWLIRCINEYIARESNQEDNCTGRFWEGRFKSQALLDEKAILSYMVYVDLNQIHAKLAKTPETSAHIYRKAY